MKNKKRIYQIVGLGAFYSVGVITSVVLYNRTSNGATKKFSPTEVTFLKKLITKMQNTSQKIFISDYFGINQNFQKSEFVAAFTKHINSITTWKYNSAQLLSWLDLEISSITSKSIKNNAFIRLINFTIPIKFSNTKLNIKMLFFQSMAKDGKNKAKLLDSVKQGIIEYSKGIYNLSSFDKISFPLIDELKNLQEKILNPKSSYDSTKTKKALDSDDPLEKLRFLKKDIQKPTNQPFIDELYLDYQRIYFKNNRGVFLSSNHEKFVIYDYATGNEIVKETKVNNSSNSESISQWFQILGNNLFYIAPNEKKFNFIDLNADKITSIKSPEIVSSLSSKYSGSDDVILFESQENGPKIKAYDAKRRKVIFDTKKNASNPTNWLFHISKDRKTFCVGLFAKTNIRVYSFDDKTKAFVKKGNGPATATGILGYNQFFKEMFIDNKLVKNVTFSAFNGQGVSAYDREGVLIYEEKNKFVFKRISLFRKANASDTLFWFEDLRKGEWSIENTDNPNAKTWFYKNEDFMYILTNLTRDKNKEYKNEIINNKIIAVKWDKKLKSLTSLKKYLKSPKEDERDPNLYPDYERVYHKDNRGVFLNSALSTFVVYDYVSKKAILGPILIDDFHDSPKPKKHFIIRDNKLFYTSQDSQGGEHLNLIDLSANEIKTKDLIKHDYLEIADIDYSGFADIILIKNNKKYEVFDLKANQVIMNDLTNGYDNILFRISKDKNTIYFNNVANSNADRNDVTKYTKNGSGWDKSVIKNVWRMRSSKNFKEAFIDNKLIKNVTLSVLQDGSRRYIWAIYEKNGVLKQTTFDINSTIAHNVVLQDKFSFYDGDKIIRKNKNLLFIITKDSQALKTLEDAELSKILLNLKKMSGQKNDLKHKKVLQNDEDPFVGYERVYRKGNRGVLLDNTLGTFVVYDYATKKAILGPIKIDDFKSARSQNFKIQNDMLFYTSDDGTNKHLNYIDLSAKAINSVETKLKYYDLEIASKADSGNDDIILIERNDKNQVPRTIIYDVKEDKEIWILLEHKAGSIVFQISKDKKTFYYNSKHYNFDETWIYKYNDTKKTFQGKTQITKNQEMKVNCIKDVYINNKLYKNVILLQFANSSKEQQIVLIYKDENGELIHEKINLYNSKNDKSQWLYSPDSAKNKELFFHNDTNGKTFYSNKGLIYVLTNNKKDLNLISNSLLNRNKFMKKIIKKRAELLSLIVAAFVKYQTNIQTWFKEVYLLNYGNSSLDPQIKSGINVQINQEAIKASLVESLDEYDFSQIKIKGSDEVFQLQMKLNRLSNLMSFSYTDFVGNKSKKQVIPFNNMDANGELKNNFKLTLYKNWATIYQRVQEISNSILNSEDAFKYQEAFLLGDKEKVYALFVKGMQSKLVAIMKKDMYKDLKATIWDKAEQAIDQIKGGSANWLTELVENNSSKKTERGSKPPSKVSDYFGQTAIVKSRFKNQFGIFQSSRVLVIYNYVLKKIVFQKKITNPDNYFFDNINGNDSIESGLFMINHHRLFYGISVYIPNVNQNEFRRKLYYLDLKNNENSPLVKPILFHEDGAALIYSKVSHRHAKNFSTMFSGSENIIMIKSRLNSNEDYYFRFIDISNPKKIRIGKQDWVQSKTILSLKAEWSDTKNIIYGLSGDKTYIYKSTANNEITIYKYNPTSKKYDVDQTYKIDESKQKSNEIGMNPKEILNISSMFINGKLYKNVRTFLFANNTKLAMFYEKDGKIIKTTINVGPNFDFNNFYKNDKFTHKDQKTLLYKQNDFIYLLTDQVAGPKLPINAYELGYEMIINNKHIMIKGDSNVDEVVKKMIAAEGTSKSMVKSMLNKKPITNKDWVLEIPGTFIFKLKDKSKHVNMSKDVQQIQVNNKDYDSVNKKLKYHFGKAKNILKISQDQNAILFSEGSKYYIYDLTNDKVLPITSASVKPKVKWLYFKYTNETHFKIFYSINDQKFNRIENDLSKTVEMGIVTKKSKSGSNFLLWNQTNTTNRLVDVKTGKYKEIKRVKKLDGTYENLQTKLVAISNEFDYNNLRTKAGNKLISTSKSNNSVIANILSEDKGGYFIEGFSNNKYNYSVYDGQTGKKDALFSIGASKNSNKIRKFKYSSWNDYELITNTEVIQKLKHYKKIGSVVTSKVLGRIIKSSKFGVLLRGGQALKTSASWAANANHIFNLRNNQEYGVGTTDNISDVLKFDFNDRYHFKYYLKKGDGYLYKVVSSRETQPGERVNRNIKVGFIISHRGNGYLLKLINFTGGRNDVYVVADIRNISSRQVIKGYEHVTNNPPFSPLSLSFINSKHWKLFFKKSADPIGKALYSVKSGTGSTSEDVQEVGKIIRESETMGQDSHKAIIFDQTRTVNPGTSNEMTYHQYGLLDFSETKIHKWNNGFHTPGREGLTNHPMGETLFWRFKYHDKKNLSIYYSCKIEVNNGDDKKIKIFKLRKFDQDWEGGAEPSDLNFEDGYGQWPTEVKEIIKRERKTKSKKLNNPGTTETGPTNGTPLSSRYPNSKQFIFKDDGKYYLADSMEEKMYRINKFSSGYQSVTYGSNVRDFKYQLHHFVGAIIENGEVARMLFVMSKDLSRKGDPDHNRVDHLIIKTKDGLLVENRIVELERDSDAQDKIIIVKGSGYFYEWWDLKDLTGHFIPNAENIAIAKIVKTVKEAGKTPKMFIMYTDKQHRDEYQLGRFGGNDEELTLQRGGLQHLGFLYNDAPTTNPNDPWYYWYTADQWIKWGKIMLGTWGSDDPDEGISLKFGDKTDGDWRKFFLEDEKIRTVIKGVEAN